MKALFRLLSFAAALLVFVFVVVDGTTSISAKSLTYTSLGEFVSRLLSPGALERLAAGVSRNLHPVVWNLINLVVFSPPAIVNLSVFALVAWIIGRRRDQPFGL